WSEDVEGKSTRSPIAKYHIALIVLKQRNPTKSLALEIFTDSELLRNTMTIWVDKWSRNGWHRSDGSPAKNRDIVEQLINVVGGSIVIFRHVEAHAGRSEWDYDWDDRAGRQALQVARDAANEMSIGRNYTDGSWIWKAYEAMYPSDDVIVAFCDGSALRNGRQDCTAAYACLFPHSENWNEVRVLNEEHVTSNRAEYRAALAALKQADRMDPNKQKMLVVFTDSELLHNTMRMWASTWSRNGWIKSDGSPVKNRDLVEQLVNLGRGRDVMYRHVKAHTGRSEWEYQWNDRADRQARGAARDADNGVW
ncbi:hypothetical protein BBJ28_00016865, partial [Nothophytophthora sp. Chile5]